MYREISNDDQMESLRSTLKNIEKSGGNDGNFVKFFPLYANNKSNTQKIVRTIEEIDQLFEDYINRCYRFKKQEDIDLVRKAYLFAREAHAGTSRHSGEPFIFHPLEVARIVTEEIGLGTTSAVCALLHDIVEDTEFKREDIEQRFGEKIAFIVEALTKIKGTSEYFRTGQAEVYRKILLGMAHDIRVIFIKLADRLHNMRTLDSLRPAKQQKVASETMHVYSPLAMRLGLYKVKSELEDLAFKYLKRDEYDRIERLVNETEQKRLSFINKFSLKIIEKLEEAGIQYNITSRPKSIYSIWNKMQKKGVQFEEVFDVFAIRIIFRPSSPDKEKDECWQIYNIIAGLYQTKPDRLRDWINFPKSNFYQALHTTVIGPEGRWVEVQIRSEGMDEIAEIGFAAHWKYKGLHDKKEEFDKKIRDLKDKLDNLEFNNFDFLANFRFIFPTEIIVYTPKGDYRQLPTDSTVLDFAFEIHTEIAYRAIGAKVNYKLVPISHILQSGDQVEVLTSQNQRPNADWLKFVKTTKAIAKIKDALKDSRRKEIEEGKQKLDEIFLKLNIQPTSEIIRQLRELYQVTNKYDLYQNIGKADCDLVKLEKEIKKRPNRKLMDYWRLKISEVTSSLLNIDSGQKKELVINNNFDEIVHKRANCCNPLPGDQVLGYKEGEGITIHKVVCNEAIKLNAIDAENIIQVEWTSNKIMSFLTRIKMEGIDEIGVVSNISTVISKDLDINIKAFYLDTDQGLYNGWIDVYVYNTVHLLELIENLKKIPGLKNVVRAED